MGIRRWKNGFRQPVRSRSLLRKIADVILFCALAAGLVYAIATYLPETTTQGRARAIDGDSLVVGGEEVRLTGIDAPEARQTCRDETGADWPCGLEAAAALKRLTQSATVTCTGGAYDDYGRLLAQCTAGTVDLNREMVRLGFALSDAEQGFVYAGSQAEAEKAKRGIWRGAFDFPHEWRARNGRGATK